MNASYEFYFSVDATLKGPGVPIIDIGNLTSSGNGSGLLGDLASFQNPYVGPLPRLNASETKVPFFQQQPTPDSAASTLSTIIEQLYDQQINYSQAKDLQVLLPDGVVIFDSLILTTLPNSTISTNLSISYRLMYNDIEVSHNIAMQRYLTSPILPFPPIGFRTNSTTKNQV